MSDNMPANISPEIAEASKQTLAEALVQAGRLPEDLSRSFLNEASKAFISGMQISALICGLIVLCTGILCLRLRSVNQQT
jgi:hypothetical protein